jgi:hypothetical protein
MAEQPFEVTDIVNQALVRLHTDYNRCLEQARSRSGFNQGVLPHPTGRGQVRLNYVKPSGATLGVIADTDDIDTVELLVRTGIPGVLQNVPPYARFKFSMSQQVCLEYVPSGFPITQEHLEAICQALLDLTD